MQSRDESKDDGEEVESINSAQDSLECGERSSEDDLQSETSVSPATAANDGQPKRTSKKKGKSTIKRPWATNARKAKDGDVDMALLNSATRASKKSSTEEEEDEDAMYCRGVANRLRNLLVHVKGYVRLQIEQLTYQLQFYDHPVAGMSSGMFPGISSGMTYQRPQNTDLQPL